MHIVISLSFEKKQIKTLFVSQTFGESQKFVENLKSIKIGEEIINITAVRKYPPKENDHDGYYLVSDQIISDQYDLFSKKTLISHGYIWNEINLEIKPVLSVHINYYNSHEKDSNPPVNLPINLPISKPIRQNPFTTKSADLINRNVYDEMMLQFINKVKEKTNNQEDSLKSTT